MDKPVDDLEEYTCAICQEVYNHPVELDCPGKHKFCKQCVGQMIRKLENDDDSDDDSEDGEDLPKCCICRAPFHPNNAKTCDMLIREMKAKVTTCKGCGEQMTVSHVRRHNSSCAGMDKIRQETLARTSRQSVSDGPNRQTFSCPYCDAKHLDNRGLLDHCNSRHRRETAAVVCPICASMPWGSSTQQSASFIAHLNQRHRFEYDTYVDYEKDDAEMMAAAIQASLLSASSSSASH